VEATARVAEFEYRAERGLPPRDPVETIYRGVLEQGPPGPETQARARQAMIDMMRTDPSLYGVEPQGAGKSPAMSNDPNARAKALERRMEVLESHPDAEAMYGKLERAEQLRAAGRAAEADSLLASLERDVAVAEGKVEQSGMEQAYSPGEEDTRLTDLPEYRPGESTPVLLDPTAPPPADPTGQILLEHVREAVARFESEGLTDNQLAALARLEAGGERSNLYDAFRGSRIDEFAKEAVRTDPRLEHVYVTVTRERGADFLDSRTGLWYDITTAGAWGAHEAQYGPGGARLPTEPDD
jgi:hypothetical protein